MSERRVACLLIDADTFDPRTVEGFYRKYLDQLDDLKKLPAVAKLDLPPDVAIVDVTRDIYKHAWVLLLASESFDVVPPLCSAPYLLSTAEKQTWRDRPPMA